MLLHGLGHSAAVWNPILAELSNEFGVCALLAHQGGAAPRPGQQVTMADLVDDVERQLDELGLDRPHVVGNSMGGWIALELAARGRARDVLALSPAGGWDDDRLLDLRLLALFTTMWGAARLLPAATWRLAPARAAFLAVSTRRPTRISPDAGRAAVQALAACGLMPLTSRGRSIAMDAFGAPIELPVTIAWSQHDRVLPGRRARARFSVLVPAAAQLDLPGVGHVPMSDDPGLVAATIRRACGR